ncbi:MAG TPA: TonB-dependent receptor [Pseudomonadales bacterium]
MYNSRKIRISQNLLAASVATIIAGMAGISGAYAQEDQLEEIQVTGTRIRNQTTITTPTPVTAVTTSELQNLNPASTMAEQLDQLPQFFNTQTAQRGGGTFTTASGSFLNLRGMGSQRTLVLLDGSRVIPADAGGATNIDNFPTALMQRVDVITGGASAAYGADALAGVVNFVLDREFEGLKTRVSTGVSEYGDGDNYNFSVAGGKAFLDDRLHVIGSVEARYIDQIVGERDRLDNWKDWGLVQNPAWVSATATPNVPRRITVPYVFDNRGSPYGVITTPGFAFQNYVFTEDGTGVRPYGFGAYSNSFTNSQSGGPEYFSNTQAFAFGPDGNEVQQRSFFGAVKYDLTDSLSVRAQAIAGRTESNTRGLRSQMTIAGPQYAYIIFQDNAYLPEEVRQEMIRTGRQSITVEKRGQIRVPGRLNAYDDRTNRDISQMQSLTVGFDWDLDDNWRLTGNYQVGDSKVQTGSWNMPRIDKFYLSIDAVRDTNGNIICNVQRFNPTPEQLAAAAAGVIFPSPLNPAGVTANSPIGPLDAAACRPMNIFGQGNVSQDAIDYFNDTKKSVREMDQDFAELLLSGDIYEGWGAGPIGAAFGLTYRDEEVIQFTHPLFGERGLINVPSLGIRGIPPGFAGPGNRTLHAFTGPSVGTGTNTVREVYGELNIPVWEFDGGQSVTTNLGFRRSDYDTSGSVDSWKIGLDVQIIEDLRWRFTKSRDVREPNLQERYFTGAGGGTINDPAFGGQVNNSLTILPSPNPGLQTEQGDTITTGFVYTPSFADWADGIQLAIDWFEIDLDKSIGLYGGQAIVNDCFNTGNAFACSLVRRDPATNIIQQILNVQTNAGGAQTRGVDVEMQYSTEFDFFGDLPETFSIRGMVGYLGERSTTTAAGIYTDFVERISTPEFTALVTANYNIGDYGIMLQSTYYDSTLSNGNNEGLTGPNSNWVEGVDVDDNTVASQTIFNLGLTYGREMENGGNWQLGFNVNNLFDRDPPIIAGTGGQALSNSHDQFGRRYQLSLNVNF